ncbi:hypothetical protein JAAARDRAFT_200844 [Jaapia argillacea MUCL 33604]|uniref:DNA 3'-5' helicase n=1 Tax=Jaapia argillacea MUCL 33604 TaxID=933084 RepID=A0A067P6M7_9AGAM|nr:hypothetical protein JAAARDRAFT_200844 [Jaapia argillacea MUCL 33604]
MIGHGTPIAQQHYAQNEIDLPYLTTEAMMSFGDFCEDWHCVLGIDGVPPVPLRIMRKRVHRMADGMGAAGSDIGGPIDWQRVTNLIQGTITQAIQAQRTQMDDRIQTAVTSSVVDIIAQMGVQLRSASPSSSTTTYHTTSLTTARGPAQNSRPRTPAAPTTAEARPTEPHPQAIMTPSRTGEDDDELLRLLRQALRDDHALFRSPDQRRLLKAVLERQHNVLGIIGTGGGKSVAFEVGPAGAESDMTLSVVPFVATMNSLQERATRLQIPWSVWQGKGKGAGDRRLVFIAAESSAARSFETSVLSLYDIIELKFRDISRYVRENQSGIARIVIDEAHNLLVSEDFRPVFNLFEKWADFPFQKVLLTATSPIWTTPMLLAKAGIPDNTITIRQPTQRPELCYVKLMVPQLNAALWGTTTSLVAKLETLHLTGSSRGIIFVRSREKAETLASSLNAHHYHGGLDRDAKDATYKKWTGGVQSRWIVATSGFTQGVDYHSVSVVIFMGRPKGGLVDFLQGAGRGGRSGEPCAVYYIFHGQDIDPITEQDWSCVREMIEWEQDSNRCSRWLLGTTMDGVGATCANLEGSTPCSFCDPSSVWAKLGQDSLDAKNWPKPPISSRPSVVNLSHPEFHRPPTAGPRPSSTVVRNPSLTRSVVAPELPSTPTTLSDDPRFYDPEYPDPDYDDIFAAMDLNSLTRSTATPLSASVTNSPTASLTSLTTQFANVSTTTDRVGRTSSSNFLARRSGEGSTNSRSSSIGRTSSPNFQTRRSGEGSTSSRSSSVAPYRGAYNWPPPSDEGITSFTLQFASASTTDDRVGRSLLVASRGHTSRESSTSSRASSAAPSHRTSSPSFKRPAPGEQGIAIQVQVKRRQLDQQARQEAGIFLSKTFTLFRQWCMICLVWRRVFVPVDPVHHPPFVMCGLEAGTDIALRGDGRWEFKKLLKQGYARNKNCHTCGMPQGYGSIPEAHRSISKPRECPFDDTIVNILWVIRHTDEYWKKAVDRYQWPVEVSEEE